MLTMDNEAESAAVSDVPAEEITPSFPPCLAEPRSVEEVGIDFERLADLALKTFFVAGRLSAGELADQMALPVFIAQELIDSLRRGKLVESAAALDPRDRLQRYGLTGAGSDKAYSLIQRNRYVGPTPVPLAAYCEVIRRTARHDAHLSATALRQAFSHLVLSRDLVDQIGPAIEAGRSLFLYGSPGNGKTTLAEAIGNGRGGDAVVPFAVEAKGEIIRVFDAAVHEILPDPAAPAADDLFAALFPQHAARRDRRWARVKRPLLVAGGELTLDQLELSYSPSTGVHQAPHQLKANGGTFLIDDFGRQRVRPDDLLNRWIVPLEKGYDYLHLASGDVIEIPFEAFVIFSTNLKPQDLVDEAFLRRIQYTIEMADPTPAQYHEIFRRSCQRIGVGYDPDVVEEILDRHYRATGRAMRSCHPRDVLKRISDRAKYEERPPVLNRDTAHWACQTYFQLHS